MIELKHRTWACYRLFGTTDATEEADWPRAMALIGSIRPDGIDDDPGDAQCLVEAILDARAHGRKVSAKDVATICECETRQMLKQIFPKVEAALKDKSWNGKIAPGGHS